MGGAIQLEQFDFHHVLAETQGVGVVFFGTAACNACSHYKSMLLGYVRERRDLNLFLVDAERELALTREFDVFHLPALFVYVDGCYHAPLQAEAHPQRFELALQAVLNGPRQEAP